MTEEKPPASSAEWMAGIRERRKGGGLKEALEYCAKGLQAFPDSMDLLFIYGEVRIECFNQAKKPEHLKAALISFEKLLKMNPRHYMANLLAARIYYMGRVWARAEEKLDAILLMSPADPRALELKAAVQKTKIPAKPAAPSEGKEAAAPADAGETEEYGQEALAKESIEGLQGGSEQEYENLTNRFSIFARLEGLRGIHLIDHAGVEVKCVLKGDTETSPANFATNVANIYAASRLCMQKSGLGTFQRGTLLTAAGNVVIVNVFYGLLALVLDPDADLKAVDARINRYVEALAE